MNVTTLVVKNLRRRMPRTLVLIATIASAFLLYGLLSHVRLAIAYAVGPWAENRIVTTNAANYVLLFPKAYASQVAQIKRIRRVTYATYFGAYLGDPRNEITAYAVDAATWLDVYSEWDVTPRDRANFLAHQDGALVGENIARAMGWHVGDHIAIASNRFNLRDGSNVWHFTVAGTFRPSAANALTYWLVVRHDYFDSLRKDHPDRVGLLSSVTADSRLDGTLARQIDAEFAGTQVPTHTVPANDFARAFYRQVSNFELAVQLISAAGFLIVLLVIASTMGVAVLERRKDLAIMRAVGFGPRRLMALVVGETTSLALLGGVLGFAAAAFLLRALHIPRAGLILGLTQLLSALLLMLAFGALSGMIPAVMSARAELARALARD